MSIDFQALGEALSQHKRRLDDPYEHLSKIDPAKTLEKGVRIDTDNFVRYMERVKFKKQVDNLAAAVLAHLKETITVAMKPLLDNGLTLEDIAKSYYVLLWSESMHLITTFRARLTEKLPIESDFFAVAEIKPTGNGDWEFEYKSKPITESLVVNWEPQEFEL